MPDDAKWHAHAAALQANSAYRATLERGRTPGLIASLPWWARVALVNFPVAVALFFMAQSAGYIPSAAQAQTAEIAKLNTAVTGHVGETEKLVARLTTALRVMCENAARDDVTRNNCRNIGPER